jgi:hypothetical protein
MAHLEVDADAVAVRLSTPEEIGALHGDVVVPLDHVSRARAVGDLWEEIRGMRAPGTGIPHVIMLGTTRGQGFHDFCAVHGRRPGVVVELHDDAFSRLLVTVEDFSEARELAATITAAAVPA